LSPFLDPLRRGTMRLFTRLGLTFITSDNYSHLEFELYN
jgi:hypothetical protein